MVAGLVLAVLFAMDRPILEAIRRSHNPVLENLVYFSSNLRGAVLPVLVGLLLLGWGSVMSRTKIRRAGVALLLAVTASGAAVAILKPTFARPGPGGPGTPKPGESWISKRYGRFPSSHAAVLFSGATAVAEFLPATAPVGYAIAILVGYGRLYDGAHFPSDVFAGAWLGIVLARFIVGRLARIESWRNDLASSRWSRWANLPGEPVWNELGEVGALRDHSGP